MTNKVIAALLLLSIILTLPVGCFADDDYRTDSANDYDKEYILTTFSGDLDSNLSIFPDSIPDEAGDVEYRVSLHSGLFDTDGEIILRCTYDDDLFANELERLAALSATIRYKDNEHVNTIIYDESTYSYPAYIANAGFGNTYEYALIDSDHSEIIYIYLAYPNPESFEPSDYLMKDLSLYEEEHTLDAYSMYNHSFDGGNSWIEFDDQA